MDKDTLRKKFVPKNSLSKIIAKKQKAQAICDCYDAIAFGHNFNTCKNTSCSKHPLNPRNK